MVDVVESKRRLDPTCTRLTYNFVVVGGAHICTSSARIKRQISCYVVPLELLSTVDSS